MADTIVLRTELRDGANVLAQLTQIDAKAKSLSAKPVTIEIKVTGAAGIENLTRQQLALATQERRRIAEANLAAAQERTKQTANQLAAANTRLQQEVQRSTTEQERQKTIGAKLALQQGQSAAAAQQHANAEDRLRIA